MKSFVFKVLLYVAIPVLIGFALFYTSYGLISKDTYWSTKDTKYIFCGHSHPECAFQDKLMPNSMNISKSGESYFYTYMKLKKILPANDKIETVYLEFGTNNIFKVMDTWTFEDKIIGQNIPRFHPIMLSEELRLLQVYKPDYRVNLLPKTFLKENLFTIYSALVIKKGFRSNTRFGGFVPLKRLKTTQDLVEQGDINPDSLELSATSFYYLNKIEKLCKSTKKNLVLVRCPVHKDYTHPKQEEIFLQVKKQILPDLKFIDFGHLITDNQYFADKGHLNVEGATYFSNYFKEKVLLKGHN